MPARIYQPLPLTVGEEIELDDKASHHLARVLRAECQDEVIIFNGQGGEYHGRITAIHKTTVRVALTQFSPREAESELDLILAQGLVSNEKMDFIVQKAVEIGVKKIIPVVTERSNVRLQAERLAKRLAHWQAIIIHACEQCGRNFLPEIFPPVVLTDFLLAANAQFKFVLSPHIGKTLPASSKTRTSMLLLVGPEGGLSEQEMVQAEARGFHPLNLGPRILRTETASIAAVTFLQCHYGDMRIS